MEFQVLRSLSLKELQAKQAALVLAAKRNERAQSLHVLIAEVLPALSMGRRASLQDLNYTKDVYQRRGIDWVESERGGRVTYHGPGQWVVYAIGPIQLWAGELPGVRKHVCNLLYAARDAIIAVTQSKCLPTVRDTEPVGLFVGEQKIASVGIAVSHTVVSYGFSVNVHRTPDSFFGISPCGLSAKTTEGLDRMAFIEDWVFDESSESLMERTVLELKNSLRAIVAEENRSTPRGCSF